MFTPKQFDSINGVPGLSERQMQEHYKLYEGYVKKANATYSDLRALKLGYSFAVNAIKSHELYFENLSGDGTVPNGIVGKMLAEQFGSYENWEQDLKATGLAARGWVWLAYDWQNNTLFNYLGDQHDAFPIWHATPLVALDVYEHAYFIDYGTTRADYINAFCKNLNWNAVETLAVKLGMNKAN